MATALLIATRKGLLTFSPDGSQWQLSHSSFLGQPVSQVFVDSFDGSYYAALNLGHFGVKLHRSTDQGANWVEVNVPSYAGVPAQGDKTYSLKLIWELASDGAGTLWCGTIPGGLFKSTDQAQSWQLCESLWNQPSRGEWFGGGYDEPGIHSICVHPKNPQQLLVGVSCGGVWLSTDAGASWQVKCQGMVAAYMPPEQQGNPSIQDPHRLVQCKSAPDALWIQHHNGIFKSDNGAELWTEIKAQPSSFGFAVAVHPEDPSTAWFVPGVKDEFRYPVDYRLVVNRTRDGGQTFEQLRTGLPEGPSFDLVYRHGLCIDATGSCLAMGSTTGNLWLSEDAGATWQALSYHLPPIYAVRFI